MSVRAKFRCTYVAPQLSGEAVYLQPVYEDHGVNKQWSEATPAGHAELVITNKGALGAFKPGKEYYLDFTEAEV